MQNEQSEILQELRRISRRTAVTAWATCIASTGVVTIIFFPQVIKQLSGYTSSLHQKFSPYLIDGVIIVIAEIALLAFVVFSIYYVTSRISGSKRP